MAVESPASAFVKTLCLFIVCFSSFFVPAQTRGEGGILQIRNGYFWDPYTAEYFIPRGIAYQTWNPPVGADQTFEQFDYDFIEFKKMYATSVRAEFVWNEVEKSPGVYDWSKPDHMVAKAEELGFKLFILVGFQYAPAWFPEEWKAVNDQGARSVVLNYEHPSARATSSNYIYQAARRFKNSAAIGGWILGNEYAYFDLWDTNRTFLGFDTYSQASFRGYLAATYSNSIAALNATWSTNYASFNAVPMPTVFPPNRRSAAYYDLIQWRKKSIGDYVAAGAAAAKLADPNHLRTYSMVGGIFSGDDILNTCEDAKTIVARCAAAGAPLHFWSINNYAWASMGSELRTGDYGIAKYQQQSGLPVMISETGHSSTENLFIGGAARQPKAVPSQIWESLLSGAIGTHIFHWSDREMFGGPFLRERGFGIVQQNRLVKGPAYWNVLSMFRQMENIKIDHLLGGSTDPRPDVQYFWSLNGDVVWPRANQENAMLWGILRRAGYQPGILDDAQFQRGDYTNAPALILSRCMNLHPADLDRIATNVIPAGIHVFADADFPGQFDAYGRSNANWVSRISSLFGLNVSSAVPGYDEGGSQGVNYNGTINFTGVANLGAFFPGYSSHLGTWKIWHGVQASSGTTVITHTGNNGSQPAMPALQIKNLGTAKAAITTFALADSYEGVPNQPQDRLWDIRYDWLRAIFRSHFGLQPVIDVAGAGAQYIFPDYRICRDGGVLIALLNGHTNTASVTISSPALLAGKTVENLNTGGIVEVNSDGMVPLTLGNDDYVLLYAYSAAGTTDQSLVNSNQNKLWFESAPTAIWPSLTTNQVTIGYDTRETNLKVAISLERLLGGSKTYAASSAVSISGKGSQTILLPVPDPDPNDINYISSREGGRYILRAWIEKSGLRVSEATIPVRLLWPVHPVSLPTAVTAGNTYNVPVAWEELPSYDPVEFPTPLNRADLWDAYSGSVHFYDIVLELRNGAGLVAWDHFLTSAATDENTFSIKVPAGASGPFQWQAFLRPAPGTSVDFFDGFENRGPGADVNYIRPWTNYVYAEFNNAGDLDRGVGQLGSEGRQAAFLIVTNPPNPGGFSGFGLIYTYPAEWSLPSDLRQWTNWSFSVDFMEEQRRACIVEMQVKDAFGGMIAFTNVYTPGPVGWQRLSATLDRFTIPFFISSFNLARVKQIVINIQMLQKGAIYAGFFDRIQFDGQEKPGGTFSPTDVIDSFEDRERGNDANLIIPWLIYPYSELNNVGIAAQGIHPQPSDGYQSAFMVVPNPVNPGNYSGFGMYYNFATPWSLPANMQQWSNYSFSFDFKEESRYRCRLELQVKSAADKWTSYIRPYAPRPDKWDSVRATLDQFVSPDGFGPFNPTNIEALAINVQMLDKNATYVASIDNIRFEGPKIPFPPDFRYGAFFSNNDSPLDSDRDGIPDIYETGTGVYVSPTNVGSNPLARDSDGDGISDGEELIAGTNPNSGSDALSVTEVQRNASGQIVISWLGHPGRLYGVHYLDSDLIPGLSFLPLNGFTNLATTSTATMRVTNNVDSAHRFYRVTTRLP